MADTLLSLNSPDLAEILDFDQGEYCASGYNTAYPFLLSPDEDVTDGWQNGSAYQVKVSARYLNAGTDPIEIVYTTDGVSTVTTTLKTKTNTNEFDDLHVTLPANMLFGSSLFQEPDCDFTLQCVSELCISSLVLTRLTDKAKVRWNPSTNEMALDGSSIIDDTLTGGKLVNATITGTKIQNATITALQIQNATITALQIANATITATQIANATITATQIANATITATQIQSATITATQIAFATITAAQIANATITATQIASATITGAQIASATITGTNIGSATITGSNIASGTIVAGNIGLASITGAQIAAATITAANIASATITGVQIGAATISGTNIQNATIVAGNLNIGVGGANLCPGSSFESDADSDGVADGWVVYTQVQSATGSIQTASPFHGVQYQRISWSGANTAVKGISRTGAVSPGWIPNATYILSFYAKSATITGSGMALGWNTPPTTQTWLVNPNLTSSWQRYSIKLVWGASVEANGSAYLTIAIAGGQTGSVDFDAVQIELGDVLTAYAPQTEEILPNSVSTGMIQNAAVIANKIANATITATQIASATITGAQIASATILSANIADGSILSADIASATILSANIAAGTLNSSNIASLTIVAGNIANLTITAAQIANATITGAKIDSATITGSNIASATITGSNVVGGTITGSNISSGTITGANIVAATITNSLIANATILGGNISAGAISGTQITGSAITAGHIASGTIVAANIASGTITGDRIAASTITSSNIAAGQITAGHIAAGTIVAGNLSAGAIDGITITGSTIRTAASGERLELDTTRLAGYSSGGTRVWALDKATGFKIMLSTSFEEFRAITWRDPTDSVSIGRLYGYMNDVLPFEENMVLDLSGTGGRNTAVQILSTSSATSLVQLNTSGANLYLLHDATQDLINLNANVVNVSAVLNVPTVNVTTKLIAPDNNLAINAMNRMRLRDSGAYTSVSTGATNILSHAEYATWANSGLYLVNGTDDSNTGRHFLDLVLVCGGNGSATRTAFVVSSNDLGGAVARSYSFSAGGALRVLMASQTYRVRVIGLEGASPYQS